MVASLLKTNYSHWQVVELSINHNNIMISTITVNHQCESPASPSLLADVLSRTHSYLIMWTSIEPSWILLQCRLSHYPSYECLHHTISPLADSSIKFYSLLFRHPVYYTRRWFIFRRCGVNLSFDFTFFNLFIFNKSSHHHLSNLWGGTSSRAKTPLR